MSTPETEAPEAPETEETLAHRSRRLRLKLDLRPRSHPDYATAQDGCRYLTYDGVLYLRAEDVEELLAQRERQFYEEALDGRPAQEYRSGAAAAVQIVRERFDLLLSTIRRNAAARPW